MEQIVVVRWRDLVGQNGFMLRAYASELWLCMSPQSVMITTPECPAEFEEPIRERLYPEGHQLIRYLHVTGIRKLDFAEGHMVTVAAFNQVPGVFSWDGGLHRAVIVAFRKVAAERGYQVIAMQSGTDSVDPATYDNEEGLLGSLDLPVQTNPADPAGETV